MVTLGTGAGVKITWHFRGMGRRSGRLTHENEAVGKC
jgi:hypothetical protein